MGTLFTYHNISTLRGERERFPVISGKDWDILGCVCVCGGDFLVFNNKAYKVSITKVGE
jgi:hypothetical protein